MKTRPIRDFPGGPGIKTPHFLHKTKKKGSFFKLKKKKKQDPLEHTWYFQNFPVARPKPPVLPNLFYQPALI